MAQMITDIIILFEYKQKYKIMNYDKEIFWMPVSDNSKLTHT